MKHLSKPEISALLQSARDWSARDHAMILVGYLHGLRASEILALDLASVADGVLRVSRLKGSNATRQPLVGNVNPLFDEIRAIRAIQPNSGRLFPLSRQRFWTIMKFHGRRAGIAADKIFPHVLKHSAAKHALAGGMPLDELQQYLGHKNIGSTACYLKSDDESASQAFAKAMGV